MKYDSRKTGPPVRSNELTRGGKLWLWIIAVMVLTGVQAAPAQIVNGDFENLTCSFTNPPPNQNWIYEAFQTFCEPGSWFVSHGSPDIVKNAFGNTTNSAFMWADNGVNSSGDEGEGLFVQCPSFRSGHTYRLRLGAANNFGNTHLIIALANGLHHNTNVNSWNFPNPSSYTSVVIQNTAVPLSTWTHIDFSFTPNTDYQQLWFYTRANPAARVELLIDSVVITEMGCPPNAVYHSFSGIPSLTEVDDYIQADVTSTVSAGQTITYKAGNYVHLQPDFHATPGTGYFHAYIAPCIPTDQPIQSCTDNVLGPIPKIGARQWPDDLQAREGKDHIRRGLPAEGLTGNDVMTNYPNPFTGKTTIEYRVPEEGKVELIVLNMLGQKVAELVRGEQRSPGRYTVEFDGSGLPSGTYYYTLRSGSFTATQKMMLVP